MKRIFTGIAGASLLVAALAFGAQRQDAVERQLKAARNTELVDGNLEAAIEQYKKIAQSGIRPLAAQALLYMAECYQKLGDGQAQRIYQQIVREYPDEKAAAAAARGRLAQAGQAARAAGDRVVWAGEAVYGAGAVSPDGRYLTDIDYNWTGNLMLHDGVTGEVRALTGNKNWSVGNAASSTFSPDGKQVAFGWRTYGTPAHINDLRIVRLDGTGLPQPKRLITSDDVSYYDPTDWSRDGRWLAVTIERKDLTKQIALIGVADANVRVLKTIGWRGPGRIFFSPDGKYIAYSLPVSDEEAQRDLFVMTVDGRTETAVVQGPSNDVLMGWSPDGAHLVFSSDRNGSVGLWTVRLADGKPTSAPSLLKPNVGLIEPIGMTTSGSLYVVRDTSTLGLHVAPIDLTAGKLTGPPVLQSFWSQYPRWSPDGQYLAYAFTGSSSRLVAIRSIASGEVRELRPALQYFWNTALTPDLKWLFVGGRDFKGRFGLFRIDAQTGATSVISNEQTAYVQLSPDGKKLYYGMTSGRPRLVERDLESGEIREVFQRPTTNGWELSPNGRLIAVIVNDNAAKTSSVLLYPTTGGAPRELSKVSAAAAFRSRSISWTPDGRALLAVKAGERVEWQELWLLPLDDGAPRKLDIDISGWDLSMGSLHPDGRQIAFLTGRSSREAWVLEKLAP